jgi:hypothetical protein
MDKEHLEPTKVGEWEAEEIHRDETETSGTA